MWKFALAMTLVLQGCLISEEVAKNVDEQTNSSTAMSSQEMTSSSSTEDPLDPGFGGHCSYDGDCSQGEICIMGEDPNTTMVQCQSNGECHQMSTLVAPMGRCEKPPQACIAEYFPVCINGVDYVNPCEAWSQGIGAVYHVGACKDQQPRDTIWLEEPQIPFDTLNHAVKVVRSGGGDLSFFVTIQGDSLRVWVTRESFQARNISLSIYFSPEMNADYWWGVDRILSTDQVGTGEAAMIVLPTGTWFHAYHMQEGFQIEVTDERFLGSLNSLEKMVRDRISAGLVAIPE
jgi:hypothetical protein